MSIWINVKNGRKYIILNDDVTNRTNGQDGQRVVLYHSVDHPNTLYIRDYDEFITKFTPDHGTPTTMDPLKA